MRPAIDNELSGRAAPSATGGVSTLANLRGGNTIPGLAASIGEREDLDRVLLAVGRDGPNRTKLLIRDEMPTLAKSKAARHESELVAPHVDGVASERAFPLADGRLPR